VDSVQREGHVAGKRATGRYNLDCAGGSSGGHGGGDFRSGGHSERGRGAVKGDVGCAGQTCPQNRDCLSHVAGGWLCFHKRPQTH
jgi:hypothetical protein